MANFHTHLNVATITTGLSATALLSAQHIDLNTALWLWFLGTIGGLLPDIDSDNSTSLDAIFNLFAISAVLIVIRYISTAGFQTISYIELIMIPLLIYAIMKYLMRPIFERMTVHRGSCHSVFFLLLMALLATQVIWRVSEQSSEQAVIIAWLSGGFVFIGGIIHLLLDELYSVDLSNVSVKRSFGTALKLADYNNKLLTLFTLSAIIALIYYTPSAIAVIELLSDWSKFTLIPSPSVIQFK